MAETLGGAFQTLFVIFNMLHKMLGGSRPRADGLLDGVWKGTLGLVKDVFVSPWKRLLQDPLDAVYQWVGL
jgi:hypothetical protein